MPQSFQLSLAPEKLWQTIDPWTFNLQGAQFSLIDIDLGLTPQPKVERTILDQVGSYGRQLGRIGDALEVLLNHLNTDNFTEAEKDTLTILKGQLAEVRQVKQQAQAKLDGQKSLPPVTKA